MVRVERVLCASLRLGSLVLALLPSATGLPQRDHGLDPHLAAGVPISAATAAAGVTDQPKVAGGPSAAPPDPQAAASMIAAFESTSDLRAFVHQASRDPARGGVFYSLRALAECRRWAGAPDELEPGFAMDRSHAQLNRRRHWVDQSRRRCEPFLLEELSDSEVQRLTALGESGSDPLLTAYQSWLDALEMGSVEALCAAMGKILQRADPALIEWVGMTGVDYLSQLASDGAALGEVARRRRLDAWALLPCELGSDCSRPDPGAASPCVAAGLCTAGLRDAILSQETWRSTVDRAALAEELAALKQAVMTRDAQVMLGVPAKSPTLLATCPS